MQVQQVAVPSGALITTEAMGRTLMFDLSGMVSVDGLLAALSSAWLCQLHKSYQALVIDATHLCPLGKAKTALDHGRQIRYTLRGIARVPMALVLRRDSVQAGHAAAYEMALEGRLMGAFTERNAALTWVERQVAILEAQASWQAAKPARPEHEPARALLGRLSGPETKPHPPPSGSALFDPHPSQKS